MTFFPNAGTPLWDDAPWRPFPPLAGTLSVDVCVVGLGGSGLTAIGRLLDLGLRVAGLDAGPVGGGAAGRNGGFLVAGAAGFYHQAVAKLGRERARSLYTMTLAEIDRIAAETPEAVRRTGSLRVRVVPEEFEDIRAQRDALLADGFPVEDYEGEEGRGILLPSSASLQPLRRCRVLAQRAMLRGARLFESSPATAIASGEVRTPGGTVRCGAVVVAVDGILERLLPELKGRVRSARLQMVATAPVEQRFPRPVSARWGWEYWQQLPDGRITLGGFRDQGGEGEWTDDIRPTRALQRRLEEYLHDGLGITAPITHRWAASAAWTTTGLPVVEEVRPRVWAAGGYCGTGNVVGAMAGRALAERAAGRPSPVWEALSRSGET